MATPTASLRRLLLAQAARDQMERRVRELQSALREQDITILARDESPAAIRIQYRHARRIHEAVFPRVLLDAEAAGRIESWP